MHCTGAVDTEPESRRSSGAGGRVEVDMAQRTAHRVIRSQHQPVERDHDRAAPAGVGGKQ